MVRTGLYLIFIFFALIVSDYAGAADASVEHEFKQRRALMQSRYNDFYVHKEKNKKFKDALKSGIEELKIKRKRWREKMEVARVKFIQNRAKPADQEALKKIYEEAEKKRLKKHRAARAQYVQRRNQLRALEGDLQKIPEEEEYGIRN